MINKKAVWNIIKDTKITIISYVDEDGFPISKAMLAPREIAGIHTFWFSTNTSSDKVQQFKSNPKASIYFFSQRFFKGISLIGNVEVFESVEAKERI